MTAVPRDEQLLAELVDQQGRTLGYLRLVPPPGPAQVPASAPRQVPGLELDRDGRRASLHGRPLDLTRLEFGLLATLASDPTRTFTRQELLQTVWGFTTQGRTRTVDLHASRLRHKLGPGLLESVYGVGYRLIDPVYLEAVA